MTLPAALDVFKTLHPGQILILTGESGIGKTTWCSAVLEAAQAVHWRVSGVISPPVFVNGEKMGIDVVALPGGLRRRLADLRAAESTGILTQRWRFDPETTRWIDDWLRALHDAAPQPDLLLIDELGPLEFERGEGWQSAFPLIEGRRAGVACVVVRPSLVVQALASWPGANVLRLTGRSP